MKKIPIPVWVAPGTTEEEWERALRIAPSLGLNTQSHQATLQNQLHAGMIVHPLSLAAAWYGWMEQNRPHYRPIPALTIDAASEARNREAKKQHEAQQAAERERIAKGTSFRSSGEAQAYLDTLSYMKWCQTPEAQALFKRESHIR